MKDELYNLMLNAIRETRPDAIQMDCRDVWNQPFFYKIDQAKAITLSYAPTDKGVRKNYPMQYEKYIKDKNSISVEQIYCIISKKRFIGESGMIKFSRHWE